MRHFAGIPSSRLRYLERLRFLLRGEQRDAVDDLVEQVDVAIQDLVETEAESRGVRPTLQDVADARENLAKLDMAPERGGDPLKERTQTQRDRAADAQHIDWMERERAFALDKIERVVVSRFIPAESMARDLRSALRLRAVRDEGPLWLDVFTLALPMMLGFFAVEQNLMRAVLVCIGVICGGSSVLLRRLPPGRISRPVYALLGPAVAVNVVGAVFLGWAATRGILLDLHVSYAAHHWSGALSFSGIPSRAFMVLGALILGMHPKALLQHREVLKRLRALDVYREDRYGYLREEALRDRRTFGYFTQDV